MTAIDAAMAGVGLFHGGATAPAERQPWKMLKEMTTDEAAADWQEPLYGTDEARSGEGAETEDEADSQRVLATVLFTDIVHATETAAALGDRRWVTLLQQHHLRVRRELAHFRGREIDAAGDGFLASFDSPARAVRCACAIVKSVRLLGLDLRAGLHTGECEVMCGKLAGISVHVGSRIAALAAPGEVLVSRTVRDLVVGSALSFSDRGLQTLRGVPDAWRLFAVEQG